MAQMVPRTQPAALLAPSASDVCDAGVGPHRRPQDEPMSPPHRAPRPAGVPRPLRVIVPALLILIWLTAGAIGGPYFGRVDEVTSNDQTTFLPESAEARSEEHTSELQSRGHLVCRLLLEKKKQYAQT